MTTRRTLAVIAGLILLLSSVPRAAAVGPSVHVIASGLDNPRGIDVSRDGRTVLVAEAGRGGKGANGFGRTGRILQIRGGRVSTLVGPLSSAISPEGEVTGPVGVSTGGGTTVFTMGGGPRQTAGAFGTLQRVTGSRARRVADIAPYQARHPDPTDLDKPPNPGESNPYGVLRVSADRTLVADAAHNDLLRIDATGRIVTMAKFPNETIPTSSIPPDPKHPLPPRLPAEAVPTSVARGPDGFYYVAELKGFPFAHGTSRIWRVSPSARNVICNPAAKTGPCTLFMGGFTSVIDLTFGADGSLYVLEINKQSVADLFMGGSDVGALWRIRGGTKAELVPGLLHTPGGVAVDRNGTIYVTNRSVSVGSGQVLRIAGA